MTFKQKARDKARQVQTDICFCNCGEDGNTYICISKIALIQIALLDARAEAFEEAAQITEHYTNYEGHKIAHWAAKEIRKAAKGDE